MRGYDGTPTLLEEKLYLDDPDPDEEEPEDEDEDWNDDETVDDAEDDD
jgi:hypothetical protein